MKRVSCRKGDIFEVKKKGKYRYFQLVDYDITNLNSDVIAVFKGEHPRSQDTSEIISQEVDFFTHTTVVAGVPQFWKKVGTAQPVDSSSAVFKGVDADKEDRQPSEGKSEHWQIWKIGKDFRYVGKEDRVPLNAELGLVFNPEAIYDKITEGKYYQIFHGGNY